MGSMLALGASSAVAQPQEVTATGVIEPAPPHAPDPTPTYAITDEATSARYDLILVGCCVSKRFISLALPPPTGSVGERAKSSGR